MMTHCVDRKINMTPLPTNHRNECLLEAYEHLEPGETLQVMDDFDPRWIRALLEDRFGANFTEDEFVVEKNAGRFVVFIQKPLERLETSTPGSFDAKT